MSSWVPWVVAFGVGILLWVGDIAGGNSGDDAYADGTPIAQIQAG